MIKEITYKYFCTLKGLSNPRCSTQHVYLGKHYMYTRYFYNFPE